MSSHRTLLFSLTLFACGDGQIGPQGPAGDPGPEGRFGRMGPRGAPGGGVALAGDRIDLSGGAFYPEGIAIAAGGALFTGSLATGAIVKVSPGAVAPEPFAQLSASALGLLADDDRDLLWACESDFTFARPSAVVGLDLAGGEEVVRHPLPAGSICNDLALEDGVLYATDSLGHRIIRIADLLAPSAAIWSEEPEYVAPPGQFGLNGIAVDGGALYAGTYATGDFFRIPIETDGSPGELELVDLGRALLGLDGLKRIGDGTFYAVEQFAGRLVEIRLTGATTGTIAVVANGLDTPTTFALHDRSAWVVQGQLDHFLGLDPSPPSLPFSIVRVGVPAELPLAPRALIGWWTSEGCEPLPEGAGFGAIHRDFAITARSWSLLLTFYDDAACERPALLSDIVGPYELNGFSSVEGATIGNFGFASIELVAFDDARAELLEEGGCGEGPWRAGEAKEVGGTGCLGFAHPIEACPIDHDIVSIDGDRLYFGQRNGNMCSPEGRPAALSTAPVLLR